MCLSLFLLLPIIFCEGFNNPLAPNKHYYKSLFFSVSRQQQQQQQLLSFSNNKRSSMPSTLFLSYGSLTEQQIQTAHELVNSGAITIPSAETSSWVVSTSDLILAESSTAAATAGAPEGVGVGVGLDPQTTILVFVIGLIPFAIATYEFWRRIAVGASFGTQGDSIVIDPNVERTPQIETPITIGEDDSPLSSRGRRTLGRDALVTAYILFAIAAGVLGLVLFSVLTTPAGMMQPPIESLPSSYAP